MDFSNILENRETLPKKEGILQISEIIGYELVLAIILYQIFKK